MAEGLARRRWGDQFDVFSAGLEKHGLNPLAVRTMAEIGIDISRHESKTLDDLGGIDFDFVITVCGHADESCPVFPGKVKRLHRGFDDPPKIAAAAATEEEKLIPYRRVRDEINAFVERLPAELAR